jgi:hypothetical protein
VIEKIVKCLLADDYYCELTGKFIEIAASANEFIIKYHDYNVESPLIAINGDKIYFASDERNIQREGEEIAFLKYAAHSVTNCNEARTLRMFDKSKASNLHLIRDALENATYKLYIKNKDNILTVNYIYKITTNKNCVLVGIEDQIKPGYVRLIAFMPNERDKRVNNKIASAIKQEAIIKPHKSFEPSS